MNKIRINFESAASEIRTDVCGRAMFLWHTIKHGFTCMFDCVLKKKAGTILISCFRVFSFTDSFKTGFA